MCFLGGSWCLGGAPSWHHYKDGTVLGLELRLALVVVSVTQTHSLYDCSVFPHQMTTAGWSLGQCLGRTPNTPTTSMPTMWTWVLPLLNSDLCLCLYDKGPHFRDDERKNDYKTITNPGMYFICQLMFSCCSMMSFINSKWTCSYNPNPFLVFRPLKAITLLVIIHTFTLIHTLKAVAKERPPAHQE